MGKGSKGKGREGLIQSEINRYRDIFLMDIVTLSMKGTAVISAEIIWAQGGMDKEDTFTMLLY